MEEFFYGIFEEVEELLEDGTDFNEFYNNYVIKD